MCEVSTRVQGAEAYLFDIPNCIWRPLTEILHCFLKDLVTNFDFPQPTLDNAGVDAKLCN